MKKLMWAVGALIVVVGVGYVLLVTLYSPDAQRAALERRLSQAFGQPAHVGPMRLALRGGLGVEARDVRIDRDPSFGEGSFVEVDRVFADLSVWDYIVRRQSAVEHIELEHPRITLVKREDGVWNWSALGRAAGAPQAASAPGAPLAAALLDVPAAPAKPVALPAGVTPSRITATGAEVVLVNRTASPPTETAYRGLALDTSVATGDGSYRLQGRVSGDSAAASGEPLAADLNFDLTLTPPGAAPVWQAHGSVPSGRLATRNVRIDRIATDVALDDHQVVRFEPLSLDLYGGKLEGRYALDLATPNNRFEAAGRLENVSLGDALAPRPDLANALRGNAGSTFDAAGELGDFSSTLASLTGTGHVTIDGAELASTNLLSEITKQGGFEQVRFDEPGTRADRIEADVRFDGTRMQFRNATVSGINGYANLRGDSGWVDLKSPASIHLEGAATLLPPLLDKLSQASPAAAAVIQIIGARPNFAVPLTVDGPFTKPSVSVRWTSVAGLPF